jgi:nicotinamidase-related amidase
MKSLSKNLPATNTGLCNAEQSILLVVDIQQRLTAAMPEEQSGIMLRNTHRLLQSAACLNIPLLVTEQYPQGLGNTHANLKQTFPANTLIFEKTSFSCCAANGFISALRKSGKTQIIISGQETHVCVLQTALQLKAEGFAVFVVEDATCSRSATHHSNAVLRMRHHNIEITNHESVLFEWLGDASHPDFKSLSMLIR